MKTYSLTPLIALTVLTGFMSGVGVVLCFLALPSVFNFGVVLLVVGVCMALFIDRTYRGCRVMSSAESPDVNHVSP